MKGIILAGGEGSRLYPSTKSISKQLLPVFDKPMIYYPISILMLCGLKDILIISTKRDLPQFKKILGDGSELGINLCFEIQENPTGIPDAYIIGERFLNKTSSLLILGDNFFHGNLSEFRNAIKTHKERECGATIFAYPVKDPERYGVVEIDKSLEKVISLEEKPQRPKTNFAIPGFYLFDKEAPSKARKLVSSQRGELEIIDLMYSYLIDDLLSYKILSRGMSWFDMGTPKTLLEASNYIANIEERQGLKVACLEEIALRMGFINLDFFISSLDRMSNSPYKDYLESIYLEFKNSNMNTF